MKLTNKLLSILLAAIMVVALIPATAYADGISVDLDDPEINITTTIDPEPDEEPVASPRFDIEVDNWGGSGTEDDPFTIHNRAGMENLSMISARGYSFSGIYFALDRDFSMEQVVISADYATIGSDTTPFAGVFDGRGHTISGYAINDAGNRVGLFRVLTGTVKNLNLSGSVKATKTAYVGGIAGKNCGTIRNCTVTGTVSGSGGNSNVGGITGENTGMVYQCTNHAGISNSSGGDTGGVAGNSKSGTIKSCHNKGDVTGNGKIGGITAIMENYSTSRKTISACTNSGTITGNSTIGGIVGTLYRCTVSECENSGNIIGTNDIGGIVANAQYSNLNSCENSGTLDAPEMRSYSNWGGIAGRFSGKNKIQGCSNTGNIAPSYKYYMNADNFGGIVGSVEDGNTIASCYNIGIICCSMDGGGIFGDGRGVQIKNCFNAGELAVRNKEYDILGDSGGGIGGYAQDCEISECGNVGKVFAEKYSGGIVGYAKYSHLANCYSSSVVTATKIAGGIAGRFDSSSLVKSISIGYIKSNRDEQSIEDFFNWLFYGDGKWDTDPDPQFGAVIGSRTNEDDPDLYLALSRNYYYQFTVTYSYYHSFDGMFHYQYEYSCPATGIGTGKDAEYSETQIRGLTEHQYRYRPDEDIYVTWDFQNVWYMTDYGPRLRHVGPLSDGGEYHVRTVDDLIKVRNMVNAGMPMKNVTVKLESDLDLSEFESWTPIGGEAITSAAVFSGTFDGGNHTISGLNIDTDESIAGLFGNVSGTIKNLKLSGSISAASYVGSIAGYLDGGTIEKCSYNGSVKGQIEVGGIVGVMKQGAVVKDCTVEGNVTGTESGVGGIAGEAFNDILIEKCSYNGGKIKGEESVGGIVGKLTNATVQNCFHTGDVTGNSEESSKYIGGIVGYSISSAEIDYCCHYTGTVSGYSYVGGVAGYAIKESSTGIGSSVGMHYSIKNCYYLTGTVLAKKINMVSIVDDPTDRGIGTKTSSANSGVIDDANPSGVAEPLTVSQFKVWSNFKHWDNEIWTVDDSEGHPVLRSVYAVVTFDANDGSGTMNRFFVPAFGGKLPACSYTRSGYAFLGWNTASDASGTFYQDKAYIDGVASLTLYAVWGVKQNVSYVDASGKSQTANNCIGLHNKLVTLNSGWYFVDGNVQYNNRINISGDVNLILKDGSSFTDVYGIHVPSDSTLTIWGQEGRYQVPDVDFTTQGTGRLTVENGRSGTGNVNAAIGGDVGETPGEIRINGGVISAYAQRGAAIGGAAGESGSFVALQQCYVSATGDFGSAAIGGGVGGDGGSVTIKKSYVSATGNTAVYQIGGYQRSFSSPAIGAGVPDVDEEGNFEELNGVNIGIEDSYVHAEAGSLAESNTVDARAIGTSLENDFDLHWISSLKGVKCEYEGVPVEYERIPYFCTKHSVDILLCTVHVGSHDNQRKCRYCGADFDHMAVVVVCDYNYAGSPDAFSYASDDAISFTVSDNVATPDGARFKGWNTAKDGSGSLYVPGQTITLDGKVTLYAQWSGTTPAEYRDTDGTIKTVSAAILTQQDTTMNNGWYIANGALTYGSRLTVNGDVKLILADDCVMTANLGIAVPQGSSLTIYGQTELYSVPGESEQTFGTGVLYAKMSGSNHSAAIGGNEKATAGTVTINGGVITAQGRFGAGIGAGDVGVCGTVNIHNGCVTATGDRGSAGIGGGGYTSGGEVNISGGVVKATGSVYSDTGQATAGIGSGRPRTNGSQPLSPGTVTITGGTVIATAGTNPVTSDGNPGGSGNFTGAMAIGVNLADAAHVTGNSLTIGDQMRVTAGASANDAEISMYAERVAACRSQYARIEVCKEHAVTGNDAAHCAYCGKELPAENTAILGDVDGDGEVTIIDATTIQRRLAILTVPDHFSETAADVDQNDDISIIDVTFIRRYLAHIKTPCRIGEKIA